MKRVTIILIMLLSNISIFADDAQKQCELGAGCEKGDRWWYKISNKEVENTQISAMVNVATKSVDGSQLSLVANIAEGNVNGFQVSVGYNHTGETIDGWQILAAANYAKRIDGAQLFGYVNAAQYVDGLQLGHINIADTVIGAQIGMVNSADYVSSLQFGLINIADTLDGAAIGLLTISDNGLWHVDYSVDETGMNMLTFASGKTFFTSYTLGYGFDAENKPWSVGAGFGYHKAIGSWYFEASVSEAVIFDNTTRWKEVDNDDFNLKYNMLTRLNGRIGLEVINGLGLFAGVNYSFLYKGDDQNLIGPWSNEHFEVHENYNEWPGFEIGIRIGR